jgi:hypothetical protein
MTTTQAAPSRFGFPPPYSVENLVDSNRRDLATDQAGNSNLSSGYIDTRELPGRCQFFFSDGRQCTMARSDIHPSLCTYHKQREEQLFGHPSAAGNVVARTLDLPELYSACCDLTTAAGVSRALAQVFRLLAQRRISRQEAATFGKLGQLLLRTISAARAESFDSATRSNSFDHRSAALPPVLPNDPLPETRNAGIRVWEPAAPINSSARSDVLAASPDLPIIDLPKIDVPTGLPATALLKEDADPPATSTSGHFPAKTPAAHNSPEISTYEISILKPVHNQHLHKNGGGGGNQFSNGDKQ